jgi:F-type H+-transporting ATPase subunit epsilon
MKQEKNFKVTISKVNELLFSGVAHSVTLPGSEGELTILAGHEALITLLRSGIISVRTEADQKNFEIEKGLLETSNGQMTILI